MILGGGVAVYPVCLLLSAHRAVMFAIAQLCCYVSVQISNDVSVNVFWTDVSTSR